MSFVAGGILTSCAWLAARKMIGLLPEDWQLALSGNKMSDDIIEEYASNRTGTPPALINSNAPADILQKGNPVYYGNGKYISMILEVPDTNQYLVIPCVDGSPTIQMHTEANLRPVATNKAPITSNRRPKPVEYRFKFPIQYLRTYGINNAEEVDNNVQNELMKKKTSNSIGFSSFRTPSKPRARNIHTYEQIMTHLRQFHNQTGCYLYTGWGQPKIEVTANITISSGHRNMDCIYVILDLVETHRFDFANISTKGGLGIKAGTTYKGVKVSDDNLKGIKK